MFAYLLADKWVCIQIFFKPLMFRDVIRIVQQGGITLNLARHILVLMEEVVPG